MQENTANIGVSVIKCGVLAATNCQPPNSNPHSRCIMELTQDYLKSILHYNPETGIFKRLLKVANNVNVGDIAGNMNKQGYLRIRIKNHFYSLHRLSFLYMTGALPEEQVDHINGIRHDNRWENLRHVPKIVNRWNLKLYATNKSGVVGVNWYKSAALWQANINVNGRRIYLGKFVDYFEAVCARKSAERLYGFHKNHGRVME
jgi:hypothetical protein